MDEGYDVVQSSLPVLLTVVKELNIPRMPSIRGILQSKKCEIRTLGKDDINADENDLGLKGSPTQVKNIFAPESTAEKKMIEGTAEEKVESLLGELKKIKCL